MEIWKDIEEYAGLYQISNTGNIVSLNFNNTGKRKMLKLQNMTAGYLKATLTKYGIQRQFSVHRLVALHFIPNINNKREVNHKNGIKTDNRVENLEWVTSSENKYHAVKNGLMKVSGKDNHLSQMLLNIEIGIYYDTIKEASESIGMNYLTFHDRISGRRGIKKKVPFIKV